MVVSGGTGGGDAPGRPSDGQHAQSSATAESIASSAPEPQAGGVDGPGMACGVAAAASFGGASATSSSASLGSGADVDDAAVDDAAAEDAAVGDAAVGGSRTTRHPATASN